MPRLTIKLDDDLVGWLREQAAIRHMSVSSLVGEMLRASMAHESDYEQVRVSFFSEPVKPISGEGQRYPRRDDLYRS